MIGAGAVLMALGAGGLLTATTTTSYPALVVQLVALGFGLGLVVPAMTATVLGTVDRTQSGIASGTLNTARQAGSVIGVALFGALVANGARLVSGLHIALAVSVALAVTVGVLTIKIPHESAS